MLPEERAARARKDRWRAAVIAAEKRVEEACNEDNWDCERDLQIAFEAAEKHLEEVVTQDFPKGGTCMVCHQISLTVIMNSDLQLQLFANNLLLFGQPPGLGFELVPISISVLLAAQPCMLTSPQQPPELVK